MVISGNGVTYSNVAYFSDLDFAPALGVFIEIAPYVGGNIAVVIQVNPDKDNPSGWVDLSTLDSQYVDPAAYSSAQTDHLSVPNGFTAYRFKVTGAGGANMTVKITALPRLQGGQTSITGPVTVDTEFGAAATVDDTTEVAAPSLVKVYSYLRAWSGSAYQSVRSGVSAVVSAVAGFLNTMPYGMYQSSPATLTNGQFAPMPLDSSQNLKVAMQNTDATVQAGTFTGAGQVIGPFDISAFRHVNFQLSGTFSLTWIAEVSTNGTDWESLNMHQESQLQTIWQSGSAGTAGRILNANISMGLIRFRCSAYVSGTGVVDVLLFPSAAPTNTQNTIAYAQGYVATDGAASGNPLLNGGRSSNVERTAMSADGDVVENWLDRRGRQVTKRMDKPVRITTATTTVVSNAAGVLSKVQATAALTGAVTIYNNTSAAGTIIQVLPIGFIGTFEPDCIMDTGITIVTAGADQLTVTYTN